MKVFYSATYQGEQEFGKFYSAIYKEIEKLGYENVDDDVVDLTYDKYVAEMNKGRESQVTNYHKKMAGIQKADICVIEVSVHSLGTGFLVQKALELAKPVIVLFYKDNTPFFLNGIDDDKLIVKSYDDDSYKKVLRDAFAVAREKRDKRFNFFLSPKLLNYIEEASTTRGITKSKLLRDMIVNHMRENKEEGSDE